ncbi:MAG: tyrosine-type recombinase/integrase, partial [Actinomycetota bacterium]|nr:tyrosine-type recombinase/integrase [Actinomycetota bacterium]
TPVDELVERYRQWLTTQRGLADRTVGRYLGTARRMLTEQCDKNGGGDGVGGLTGSEVTAFLLCECTRLPPGSAKGVVAELRSLRPFLYVQGLTLTPLAAAVPPVAGWRDTRLPATLSAADVGSLLDSCDRSEPAGRRDYAILVLLARLGLRSAEVAGLRTDDLHWRRGEVLIRGKGRRDDRLSLPKDVGELARNFRHLLSHHKTPSAR